MSLSPGTRIGIYDVTALIGEAGVDLMGSCLSRTLRDNSTNGRSGSG